MKMTESDFRSHVDCYNGLCLGCGDIREGDIEPDAENYPCDSCGEDAVVGIENALIMGKISIVREPDETAHYRAG